MNRVSGSLRELGLQDKHLQTTGARVYSRYGKDEVTVVGYRASQALAVICPDVSLAGRCLTAAAEAGGGNDLGIDGIRLEISDPAPLRLLARERAFADAHTMAAQYAELAGRNLGPLESLQEADGVGAPLWVDADLSSARAAAHIEGGQTAVSVTMTARWSFADPNSPSRQLFGDSAGVSRNNWRLGEREQQAHS
jgi:uncharacterized protein YggE